jgi:hypothetical protein
MQPLFGNVLQNITARLSPCNIDVNSFFSKSFQPAMLEFTGHPRDGMMEVICENQDLLPNGT